MEYAARNWRSLKLGKSDSEAGCHLEGPLWPLPSLARAGPLCNCGEDGDSSNNKGPLSCAGALSLHPHWTCMTSQSPSQKPTQEHHCPPTVLTRSKGSEDDVTCPRSHSGQVAGCGVGLPAHCSEPQPRTTLLFPDPHSAFHYYGPRSF